jgi:hypothetical protein
VSFLWLIGHNVWSKKARSVLTAIAIAIGVMVAGRPFGATAAGEVLVGSHLAQDLNVQLGQRINLTGGPKRSSASSPPATCSVTRP